MCDVFDELPSQRGLSSEWWVPYEVILERALSSGVPSGSKEVASLYRCMAQRRRGWTDIEGDDAPASHTIL